MSRERHLNEFTVRAASLVYMISAFGIRACCTPETTVFPTALRCQVSVWNCATCFEKPMVIVHVDLFAINTLKLFLPGAYEPSMFSRSGFLIVAMAQIKGNLPAVCWLRLPIHCPFYCLLAGVAGPMMLLVEFHLHIAIA